MLSPTGSDPGNPPFESSLKGAQTTWNEPLGTDQIHSFQLLGKFTLQPMEGNGQIFRSSEVQPSSAQDTPLGFPGATQTVGEGKTIGVPF